MLYFTLLMAKAFIVAFEGGDGSGKGTQFELLKARSVADGLAIAAFDFPQYGKPSAEPIEANLRGEIRLSPLATAKLYADDRLAAKDEIMTATSTADLVLFNRYVASNIAYQGARTNDQHEREAIIEKIEDLEYVTNGLPKPDLTIVLSVEPRIAQQHIDKKEERSYTTGRDVYEADLSLQTRAAHMYHELCVSRDDYIEVFCMLNEETMRSREEIHAEVWELVRRTLAKRNEN